MLKPVSSKRWNLATAAHLLNRAGFGGTPAEIEALHGLGLKGAVDHVLSNADEREFPLPDWAKEEARRAFRDQMRKDRRDLAAVKDPAEKRKLRQKQQRALRGNQRQNTGELIQWWMNRFQNSRYPLREKMTLFWHDHFATSTEKVRIPELMLDQNQTFRTHALGNFRDLVESICRDPAMMIYLDNDKNRRGKPNENFAREIMELFTLGEGQYSETDVKEVARAFTGYVVDRRLGQARFVPKMHDQGKKTILGKTGRFRDQGVVSVLLEQKACARFLSTKLFEFFAYENPGEETVDALAGIMRASDYDIEPVMRALLLSDVFYSEKSIGTQIKSPVQFLVQMTRQLEMEALPMAVIAAGLSQMGQVLFRPPNVAGWDGGKSWINTNTLLNRYNVAGLVAKGALDKSLTRSVLAGGDRRFLSKAMGKRMKNYKGPDYQKLFPGKDRQSAEKLVDGLIHRFFQHSPKPEDRQRFIDYAKNQQMEGLTNLEIGELVHLMLSTPIYQLA